jgi:hypothetical protein
MERTASKPSERTWAGEVHVWEPMPRHVRAGTQVEEWARCWVRPSPDGVRRQRRRGRWGDGDSQGCTLWGWVCRDSSHDASGTEG